MTGASGHQPRPSERSGDGRPPILAIGAPERWMPLAVSTPSAQFPAGIVGVSGWESVRRVMCLVDAVLVLPPPDGIPALLQPTHPFRAHVTDSSPVPLVVAVPGRPDALSAIRAALISRGVLTMAADPSRLWRAVERASVIALLAETATTVERVAGAPSRIRRVLVAACRGPTPVTSVGACAALVQCHRRTLWREWGRASMLGCAMELERVLWWLIALRTRAEWTDRGDSGSIAAYLGLDRATLARIVGRTFGTPLTAFGTMDHRDVARLYRAAVLSRIARFAAGGM